MNPVTGTTVWSVDVPLTGDGGFIQDVSDPADQVIVAHTARQTTVLDAATGRLVWRGDGWWGTGRRLDNLLVMDQADGPRDTLGIDWTTGAQRWRQSAPAKTQTDAHAPDALGTDTHVDGDAVVMTQQLTPWSTSLGAYRGEWLLGVRDPATGTPRWHTTLPTASGTFLVIGTTLITASFDGSLAVGYDVATGARKWKTPVSPAQPLEGPSASYLAQIDTDTVLVSTSRLGSTALRASTGAPLWTDPATLPSDEPTVFRVGGKSYLLATFADHDGAPESVEVRDPSTGHPLHRTPLHVAYRRLASDTAYTIADDFLIALRLPELTERWRVPLRLPPGGMASIAAVVPNTVILDIETLSGVHQIQGAFVGYGVP
jgi:outer membrane protein assembly factor BamB